MTPKAKEQATRATIYTRVSFTANRTGTQARPTGEESPERQEKLCRAYCVSKDLTDVTVKTDVGISAFKDVDRPGWAEVVAAVENGGTDAVVVSALDRAGRSMVKLVQFAELCKEHGVAFVSTSQDINTGGQYGKVILGVFGAVAEIESAVKRERALSKHLSMAEAGRYAGSWRPFGYTRDDMTQVSAEAEAVRSGAESYLNGSSLQAVAAAWNAAGLRTTAVTKKRPDGGEWTYTAVQRVFANPVYIGVRLHVGVDENGKRKPGGSDGVEYKGAWEPILAKSTFKRLGDRLAENRERTPRRSAKYMLTGLVFCGLCDLPFAGRPSKGVRRYGCRTGHLSIPAQALETYVGDLASTMLVKSAMVRDPATLSAPLLAQLDAVEGKLSAFARNAAEAGFTAAEMRDGRAPLAAERDRIIAELEALAEAPGPAPILITKDAADGLYTPEWTAMIAARVDRITVREAKRGTSVESRTDIIWRDGVTEANYAKEAGG